MRRPAAPLLVNSFAPSGDSAGSTQAAWTGTSDNGSCLPVFATADAAVASASVASASAAAKAHRAGVHSSSGALGADASGSLNGSLNGCELRHVADCNGHGPPDMHNDFAATFSVGENATGPRLAASDAGPPTVPLLAVRENEPSKDVDFPSQPNRQAVRAKPQRRNLMRRRPSSHHVSQTCGMQKPNTSATGCEHSQQMAVGSARSHCNWPESAGAHSRLNAMEAELAGLPPPPLVVESVLSAPGTPQRRSSRRNSRQSSAPPTNVERAASCSLGLTASAQATGSQRPVKRRQSSGHISRSRRGSKILEEVICSQMELQYQKMEDDSAQIKLLEAAGEDVANRADVQLTLRELDLEKLRGRLAIVVGELQTERASSKILKEELDAAIAGEREAAAACSTVSAEANRLTDQLRAMLSAAECERDELRQARGETLAVMQTQFERVVGQRDKLAKKHKHSKGELEDARRHLSSLQAMHDSVVTEHQLIVAKCQTSQETESAAEALVIVREELETVKAHHAALRREHAEALQVLLRPRGDVEAAAALAELGIDMGESAAQSGAVVDQKDELGQVENSISTRIERLQQHLESQIAVREGLSKSHSDLEQKLCAHQAHASALESHRDGLLVRNRGLQDQHFFLLARNLLCLWRREVLSESRDRFKAEHSVAKAERDQLEQHSGSWKEKHASSEAQREQLAQLNLSLHERHVAAQAALQTLQTNFEAKSVELDSLKAAHDDVARSFDSKHTEIVALTVKHAEISKLHVDADSSLASAQAELSNIKAERDQLSNDIDLLRRMCNDQKESEAALKQSLEERHRHADTLARELGSLKEQHSLVSGKLHDGGAAAEILQQQVEKLTSERNQISSDYEHLQNVLHKREEGEIALRDALQAARQEITAVHGNHESDSKKASQRFHQEIARIERERDRLNDAVSKAEASELRMRRSLEEKSRAAEDLETQVEVAHAEKEALDNEIEELRERLNSAESERDRSLNDRLDLKGQTQVKLKQNLEELRKDKKRLEKELQDKKDELEPLTEKLELLEEENDNLKNALEEEASNVRELEKELEDRDSRRQSRYSLATVNTLMTEDSCDPDALRRHVEALQMDRDELDEQNQKLQQACTLHDQTELGLRRALDEERAKSALLEAECAGQGADETLQILQKELSIKKEESIGMKKEREAQQSTLASLKTQLGDEKSKAMRFERAFEAAEKTAEKEKQRAAEAEAALKDTKIQLSILKGEMVMKQGRAAMELGHLGALGSKPGAESPDGHGSGGRAFVLGGDDDSTIHGGSQDQTMSTPGSHSSPSKKGVSFAADDSFPLRDDSASSGLILADLSAEQDDDAETPPPTPLPRSRKADSDFDSDADASMNAALSMVHASPTVAASKSPPKVRHAVMKQNSGQFDQVLETVDHESF